MPRQLSWLVSLTCLLSVISWPTTGVGADLRTFSDANLHAVTFLDEHEGWACGDQGTIWHTMDGGMLWERQPTGTRATLTDLHIRDFRFVRVSGRESLPYNPGSAGLILETSNGGIRWNIQSRQQLSGVKDLHFFDELVGWSVGETTDQHATGVFFTTDGGKSWSMVRGNRQHGWSCAWFPPTDPAAPAKQALEQGVLGGFGGNLAKIRQGVILPARIDWLPGTNVRDIDGTTQRLWVVGEQAQIFYSEDQGESWLRANVKIPFEIQRSWDLNAVSTAGSHIWAVGRPGSVVLHSPDNGASWELQQTGQPLPLNDIHFVNAQKGWAVGALGTILCTDDGGQSWKMQRPLTVEEGDNQAEQLVAQSRRAAMLWLTDSGERIPFSAVARYGGDEGYYCAALAMVAPDLSDDQPSMASRPARFAEAFRAAGGAVAESSWKYPLNIRHAHDPTDRIMAQWNRLYEGKAAEEMERDLVLAIRMWQPEVIVTDPETASGNNPVTAAIVALGAKRAFASAADPNAFPEQIQFLGLKPHKGAKLYARRETGDGQILHSAGDFGEQLGESYADAADVARALVLESYEPTEERSVFSLTNAHTANAQSHRKLTDGTGIMPGDIRRRQWSKVDPEISAQLQKKAEQKRNLLAIAARDKNPQRLLAQLKSQTEDLSNLQAGHAIFQIAQQFMERGDWHLAHPLFEYVASYYPEHPLALEAYRWLIAYQCSSEARQRADKLIVRKESTAVITRSGTQGSETTSELNPAGTKQRWNEVALIYGDQLRRISGQLWADPRIQMCLASAHRTLGNTELLDYHFNVVTAADPKSRWNEAIAMERWYFDRAEQPPRQVAWSVQTAERPYLDGKLNDACWSKGRRFKLSANQEDERFNTTVYLRHDDQFLYLAASCRYPDASYAVEAVKRDGHDADLTGTDRLELLLDLDRDYNTFYRLQVDQRGLVREDCWGDASWNPKWFVATQSEENGWGVELAIPINELTDNSNLTLQTWAFNVTRIVPGESVLGWTHPVSTEPRPEGFSFLKFVSNDRSRALQPLAE